MSVSDASAGVDKISTAQKYVLARRRLVKLINRAKLLSLCSCILNAVIETAGCLRALLRESSNVGTSYSHIILGIRTKWKGRLLPYFFLVKCLDIFLNGKNFLFFRVTSNPHNICRYFVSRQELRTEGSDTAPEGSISFLSAQLAVFWERPYNQLVRLKLKHHWMVQSQKLGLKIMWWDCFPWIWPLPCSHHRDLPVYSLAPSGVLLHTAHPPILRIPYLPPGPYLKAEGYKVNFILKISEPQMPTDSAPSKTSYT